MVANCATITINHKGTKGTESFFVPTKRLFVFSLA
jgi:hypothetical protein